jgi:hypothetical protein
MTTLSPAPPTATAAPAVPGRRILVGLAVVYVVFFAVIMLNGDSQEPETSPAKLLAVDRPSRAVIEWMSYAGMIACAVLVFYGAALRAALATRGRRWTADVAFAGFVAFALTLASWAVSGLAVWHAADIGDGAAIRAMNLIDTSNFLPALLAMPCVLLGVGLTALATRSLPLWLTIVSIVLGLIAPLGPAGFIAFLAFPVWMIVVAATVRLDSQ